MLQLLWSVDQLTEMHQQYGLTMKGTTFEEIASMYRYNQGHSYAVEVQEIQPSEEISFSRTASAN